MRQNVAKRDRENLTNAGPLPLLYVRTEVLAFRRFCKYFIGLPGPIIGRTAYG
jgi:hypothetical protein